MIYKENRFIDLQIEDLEDSENSPDKNIDFLDYERNEIDILHGHLESTILKMRRHRLETPPVWKISNY